MMTSPLTGAAAEGTATGGAASVGAGVALGRAATAAAADTSGAVLAAPVRIVSGSKPSMRVPQYM